MKFEKRTIYYIVVLFAIIVVFYQLTNYLDNRQDLNIPITPVKLEIKDLDQGQTKAKHSEVTLHEEDANSSEGTKKKKNSESQENPQANNQKQDNSKQSAGEALEVGVPAGSKLESQSQSQPQSHKQAPAQGNSQQQSSQQSSPGAYGKSKQANKESLSPAPSSAPVSAPAPVKANSAPKKAASPASSKTAPPASKHKGTLIKPIVGKISTGYGLAYSEIYEDYRLHPAVDIKAKSGTSVKAALQGKVLKITRSKREKIRITINHGEGLITSYAHIGTAKVKKGSTVDQGQVIGILGKPGSAETKQGSHIHFEVEDNKKLVNPKDYLK